MNICMIKNNWLRILFRNSSILSFLAYFFHVHDGSATLSILEMKSLFIVIKASPAAAAVAVVATKFGVVVPAAVTFKSV